MKIFLPILILTLLVSCNNCPLTNKKETQKLEVKLLVGEWRLDSSSNARKYSDRLILLEDGHFYIFSGTDGGSLISKGKMIGSDSLHAEYDEKFKIQLLDSSKLEISGGFDPRFKEIFRRSFDNDYKGSLKRYLAQDSLRKKVIGWWKLTKSARPVKLINYGGYHEKFTLNISEDGSAVFYLENKFDSTVYYSYQMNTDGMDFNRGCIVGSDSKISFTRNGDMKLLLENRFGDGDTLILKKLTEIK